MNKQEQLAEQIAKSAWDLALTMGNNLCVQISDRYNNDDLITEADTANECAKKVREWIGQYPPELFSQSVEAMGVQQSKSDVKTFIGEGLTGWQVGFAIGCQTFYLQQNLVEERGTKEWAEWLERCLKTAFNKTEQPAKAVEAMPDEQIKKELVAYFGDYAQAEMAYSICFNRQAVEATDSLPAKKDNSITNNLKP
jgi:hypothetical protein